MAEQLITNALKDVIQEIRVQNLTKHVRAFHGEGAAKFSNWLKDMEPLSASCDSERMCVLSTLTLGGSAGAFVSRLIKENPIMSWTDLKRKLKDRYSDLTDPAMTKERCRRLKQAKGESVQNFAERINTTAVDAYDEIQAPHAQEVLVDVFQKGVQDDRLARNLIRKKFKTLEEAVGYATEEQRTDRTFEMYRHAQKEPMEVDVIQQKGEETQQLDQIQENLQRLFKQLDRVSRQVRPAQNMSQSHSPRHPSNQYRTPPPPIPVTPTGRYRALPSPKGHAVLPCINIQTLNHSLPRKGRL